MLWIVQLSGMSKSHVLYCNQFYFSQGWGFRLARAAVPLTMYLLSVRLSVRAFILLS